MYRRFLHWRKFHIFSFIILEVRENKQLKGYVVKLFDSPSLFVAMYGKRLVFFYKLQDVIQEGRQRNLWTRNKHYVSLISENMYLHNQQGVIFSMLLKVTSII